MPKPSTAPTLIEHCTSLSITELKKWGYLEPNNNRRGTVTEKKHGIEVGSFGISVDMGNANGTLWFNYTITDRAGNKEHINNSVAIISQATNIGNGVRYYFICPATDKKAMKLYLASGQKYFLHREAIPNLMYMSQTISKRWREWDKTPYAAELMLDNLALVEHKKYRKKHYRGRLTRWYKPIHELRMRAGIYR